MAKVWGYCRISRPTQNIERQERNIKEVYPDAYIFKEAFTGTKILGRKELDKLLHMVEGGDTIVFDSASRMSGNEEEALVLYEELFQMDVSLVFLKEPHINTEVFRNAIENQIKITMSTGNDATDVFIQSVISALNRYTVDLAKEQIRLVFAQAQKEVEDLHRRTVEGIITAKLNGKQIGHKKGTKLTTKKSIVAKEVILKYSRDFNGTLKDADVIKLAGIDRKSFYKYKSELKENKQ